MEHRLISYLYFFNVRRDYFECHEYGESLWLDTGRPIILKGLIQAAVCLYHLHGGNVKGGGMMWERAKGYLEPYLPVYENIDLVSLIADIDAVFAQVPPKLHGRVVSPDDVRALALPVVDIRILDPDVADQLPIWNPAPLDGNADVSADVDES